VQLDLASDRGAVTAEFMLLLPALIVLFSVVLGSVSLAVERIALEAKAFEIARQSTLGIDVPVDPTLRVDFSNEGRLECARVQKQLVIPISTKICMLPIGR